MSCQTGTSSIETKLYRDTLQDSSGETWQEVAQLNSASFPDKSRETIDFTHLNTTNQYRIFQSGMRNPGMVRFNINFTKTQYGRLNDDFNSNCSVVYKLVLSDSPASEFVFEGLITRLGGAIPEGSGKVTDDIEIQLSDEPETEPGEYIYVTEILSDTLYKYTLYGDLKLSWGRLDSSSGSGDGQFDTPRGVAVDGSGNVYVTDYNNNRIQKFDSSGNFILKWGSAGSGDGQFNGCSGIAVDSSRNVYVSDVNDNRIQKFDSSGNFILKWGSAGSGDGQFNGPWGVAINNDDVYISDTNNHRIQKFDSSGNFILKWGSAGSGDGQFNNPSGIAVDGSRNVYVAEFNSPYRVQKFDSSGNFILKWGSGGSGDGQFWNAAGVAVDNNNDIYVSDTNNHRIQKFDSSGNFLSKFAVLDPAFLSEPQQIAIA